MPLRDGGGHCHRSWVHRLQSLGVQRARLEARQVVVQSLSQGKILVQMGGFVLRRRVAQRQVVRAPTKLVQLARAQERQVASMQVQLEPLMVVQGG